MGRAAASREAAAPSVSSSCSSRDEEISPRKTCAARAPRRNFLRVVGRRPTPFADENHRRKSADWTCCGAPAVEGLRPTRDDCANPLRASRAGIEGARFLDLWPVRARWARSASPRGAAHFTFVESARRALRLHRGEPEAWRRFALPGRGAGGRILQFPPALGRGRGAALDVAFYDPPYSVRLRAGASLFARARRSNRGAARSSSSTTARSVW